MLSCLKISSSNWKRIGLECIPFSLQPKDQTASHIVCTILISLCFLPRRTAVSTCLPELHLKNTISIHSNLLTTTNLNFIYQPLCSIFMAILSLLSLLSQHLGKANLKPFWHQPNFNDTHFENVLSALVHHILLQICIQRNTSAIEVRAAFE